jgi:hypothetical protein
MTHIGNNTTILYYKNIKNKLNTAIKNNHSINIQNKYERILLQIQDKLLHSK